MSGKKRTIWNEVTCSIHGTKFVNKSDNNTKIVTVTATGDKKVYGCPTCIHLGISEVNRKGYVIKNRNKSK